MIRVLVLGALLAVAACAPDTGPDAIAQCSYPLVACEGDPKLCPVAEPTCRILNEEK